MPNTGTAELDALRRLQSWDGLGKIAERLKQLKRRANLFSISPGITRSEALHSDFLAWLVDPKGAHGLTRFGGRLAAAALGGATPSVPTGPLEISKVEREAGTGGGPIDLLVRGRAGNTTFVLGIENKVDAGEGDGQLNRYADGLRRKLGKDQFLGLVFLTPEGRAPEDQTNASWRPMGYHELTGLLDQELGSSPPGSDEAWGRQLAKDYVGAIRTYVMRQADPIIDALCKSLLTDHADAWRAIRARLPSEVDDIHLTIARDVSKRLTEELGPGWGYVVRQDRYACVFRQSWTEFGTFDSHLVLDSEHPTVALLKYPRLHFRLSFNQAMNDGEDRRYEVRLKVHRGLAGATGRRLATELKKRKIGKVPTGPQFTLPLGRNPNLPAMSGDIDATPPEVVEWSIARIQTALAAIDRVVRKS